MKKKEYYWDEISEIIGQVILKTFKNKDMSILEIGFGSGHFLEWMNESRYTKLNGIEIRQDQFLKTKGSFDQKNLNHINLMCGDVLEHNEKYDAIFSTGLIQCLNEIDRKVFEKHVSKLADLAIFTVPEIFIERNINSEVAIAVAGCREFKTGNIAYELSMCYDAVRVGRIDREKTHLDDSFIYYVCEQNHDRQ